MKYYKDNDLNYFTFYKSLSKGIKFCHYGADQCLRIREKGVQHNLKGPTNIFFYHLNVNNVLYFIHNQFVGNHNKFKSNKEFRKYTKLLVFQ